MSVNQNITFSRIVVQILVHSVPILESSGDFDYCAYTMRLNANIILCCLVVFHNWYPFESQQLANILYY